MAEAFDPPVAGGRADALWRFARTVYGRPGVATACLELQDRFGANVVLLLYAAWAGAVHDIALTDTDLAQARSIAVPWHTDVVEPLRHVRRRLKFGPAPAPSPATAELRARLQALEIDAERLELAALAAILSTDSDTADSDTSDRADATAANLSRLVPSPAAAPFLAVLAYAARSI
jgi:uncharacterized protein (TIGR02444 family)